MKFALITADPSHKKTFRINPENGDATSFMQWVYIFGGIHLSYDALRTEDNEYLKNFDVVMMSGHLNYMTDVIRIAKFLKDSEAISIFYPEGSAQLYDNGINGFHPEYYEAWRACDILSIVEEDKYDYYRSFINIDETIVSFIHVPMTAEMSASAFFLPRGQKRNSVLIYGDNNPNHPMIALAAVNELNKNNSYKEIEYDVVGVETRDAPVDRIFPDVKIRHNSKSGQYQFLRALAKTIVNFYPTEWIGTARHQISCAVTGTPCIGNKDSHTQKRLFPKLGVGIYEIDKMVELAEKLIGETGFYHEVTEYALNAVRYYDYGNTVRRFMNTVDNARARFKAKKTVGG